MIPITRKEHYLNKIVGNDDYDIPEKPISEEELFFAKILGEAVQAPEPLTRYQMYLAKIAGRNIEIPTPITRLEYFLARAAGMDIETPTPITREEIFWSNYTAIVDFEVEGVPPLTYKAIEGTLENYRIYGNTVGGESVGDKTGNLFDFRKWSINVATNNGNDIIKNIDSITLIANTFDAFTVPYAYNHTDVYKINVNPNATYVLSWSSNNNLSGRVYIFKNGVVGGTNMISVNNAEKKYLLFDTDTNTKFVTLRFGVANAGDSITYSKIMLIEGSGDLPYEPYGYRVAVTVSNGTDTLTTPIYIPEQIKKGGEEVEYIDYSEQKLHRVGADDIDVTLPALPTLAGTNVLTVGTAVQPSEVYIKYEGAR